MKREGDANEYRHCEGRCAAPRRKRTKQTRVNRCACDSNVTSINKAMNHYVNPTVRHRILIRDCFVRCSLRRMSVLLAKTKREREQTQYRMNGELPSNFSSAGAKTREVLLPADARRLKADEANPIYMN